MRTEENEKEEIRKRNRWADQIKREKTEGLNRQKACSDVEESSTTRNNSNKRKSKISRKGESRGRKGRDVQGERRRKRKAERNISMNTCCLQH